ncbi:MAG: GIY-YIG nuclease family protein [Oligoflexia bacterium]|nr:GIY-YIG nuclease family protein [Oligoflexia bacterium]
MTEDTSDEQLLADLGIEIEPESQSSGSARDLRIIAGFEEIEKFVELNGHPPEHGENKDIFERIYAARLDRIRASEECRNVLVGKDRFNLLQGYEAEPDDQADEMDDESLLAELGAIPSAESDITKLKHVRTRAEVRAAEEMARRTPCVDFDKFKPLFTQVQKDIAEGERETISYKYGSKVNAGDLYILNGQKAYVANVSEEILDEDDKTDRRLRVIFDNGTESNLLLRSLQRALLKDTTSRRITDPTLQGPLFSGIPEASDTASGTVYVLRSKSDHPTISKSRDVIHKIGVTSGNIEKRISNAKIDPTFLMADVEIVASYELSNMSRSKLEGVIHKFFEPARLDIEIKDRFGNPVVPREWFLVPLFIINEAIERIKDGSIVHCRYDVKIGKIVEGNSSV